MRILVLNTDYQRFLAGLYGADKSLAHANFETQLHARNESLFGVADFYSRNFKAHGHEAWEIHLNNPWLQGAWAREHGLGAAVPPGPELTGPVVPSASRVRIDSIRKTLRPLVRALPLRRKSRSRVTPEELRIFLAQVNHYRPDVILNQDMDYIRDDVLGTLRARGIRIVGQIAAPMPANERYTSYDLVISSLPNFVEWFRSRGVPAELNRLAFEPRVLDMLGAPPPRDVDVSFVGSLSPEHGERIALLETISQRVNLQLWGNSIERLHKSSPLWACYRGEAWGRDMYEALRRSKITINHHIDLSAGYANNMRLYEATGVGTTLLVDKKRNLAEIFADDEVATYTSADDCLKTIEGLLADEAGCAAIGARGQARTLHEHNYFRRTGEILELVRSSRK